MGARAVTSNPHWIEGYPAWDITLPTGDLDKGVSMREIQAVHQDMDKAGLLSTYEWHIDVVRDRNVQNYATWRATNNRH